MRIRRFLLVTSSAAAVATVSFAGCRDATQITLDISLRRAACTEIHGTAITIGVDAADTEQRVSNEYVTASTTSCDPASIATASGDVTHSIGTLVVTPSDAGHGSVVVVVAYDQVAPSSCKPPLFKGCIVARRQFSFTDHQHLMLPITIDPDCKDVPCDAFSTCRTGKCFDSSSNCSGDTCVEPGDPGDGGTSEAGVVTPDTGIDDAGDSSVSDSAGMDSASSDASQDASTDAPAGDGGTPPWPYCAAAGELHCAAPDGVTDVVCLPPQECCTESTPAGTKAVCEPAGSCPTPSRACCSGGTNYCGDAGVCGGAVVVAGPAIGLLPMPAPGGTCGP